MRKLEVSLVASLIVIVVLATTTLYFHDLGVLLENRNKSLRRQFDTSQNLKNSLVAQNEELIDQIEDLTNNTTLLQSENENLQNDIDALQNQVNVWQTSYTDLNESHTQINQIHQILILEYNELNASYQILEHNYTDLSDEYAFLQGKYASLFNDHNTLLEAFNEPLFYEEIPTTSELDWWLTTDETDEIWYDHPDFVCGDFAVMLSQHAKLEHWDMGVVAVFGYDENYDSFAHAFNVIITTEGLVYIEPQADDVWWYADHEEISEDIWWEISDFGYIYVEEYVVTLWYD